MDYRGSLDYIDSFINFEKIPQYNYTSSFKLERMLAFLRELGNPQEGFNAVHIAGSKGKGSTSAVIAYILKESGYKTGLFTSPHLLDTRERIRILDVTGRVRKSKIPCGLDRQQAVREIEGIIEENEFVELIESMKPVAERFREHKILGRLSFFELLTAAAFLYFKKMQVDIAVLETGLGGRLDATNVVRPLVCGITNISMEHADKLGSVLADIATEKAGIIKKGSVVITVSQKKEVVKVIERISNTQNASLYRIGKDITYTIKESNQDVQIFDLYGPLYSYRDLKLSLIGRYQIENASLAIAVVKAIERKGLSINEEAIRSGLKKVSWPGRLQVVRRDPYLILDGAQNVASIKAVLFSLKKLFKYDRLICIFGISSDKDIKGVARELDNACDVIILTKSKNIRAEDPVRLRDNFQYLKPCLALSKDTEDAMKMAIKISDPGDLILVTGSLFLVAEFLTLHF